MNFLKTDDTSFSHSFSSSWYHKPNEFTWDRNIISNYDEIVVTNLFNVSKYPNHKVYGWIIEPPEISPNQYDFAKKNFSKFEKIFTYDKELLSISNIFEFVPIGGCWIEENEQKIYKKTKLVSTINSSKNITSGHRLRHKIIPELHNVDLYGRGFNEIKNKCDGLKDYMFTIVIENQKMDFLFTEKLIDCFLTGTIPIYNGCPSIGNFFDLGGIIIFNDIEELKEIMKSIDEKFYYDRIDKIKKNYDSAKNYTVADNIIYEKIKKNGNKN